MSAVAKAVVEYGFLHASSLKSVTLFYFRAPT